ncbi:hypothetical protein [Allorhizobium sonneratiae]|uniref:hypothetical protein n=1 Tax=Allorhizobium sonneratiae TaxID=2934936 RepID=UPI0020345BD8|nr:hypothetical protein [Allorhizobium sonneratiae]
MNYSPTGQAAARLVERLITKSFAIAKGYFEKIPFLSVERREGDGAQLMDGMGRLRMDWCWVADVPLKSIWRSPLILLEFYQRS